MKALKITWNIIKWIIIVLIILFSLATFLGKSYGQTMVLLVIAALLAYWPKYFRKKWNNIISTIIRVIFIVIIFSLNLTVFKSEPKTTIYTSEENKQELLNLYDAKQYYWHEDTEDEFIKTKYGIVHLLTNGSKDNPPLVMFHAASMGAHSWAENLEPLLNHYRIYSFDNIGEGNKSQLYDARVYPKTDKEIAEMYAGLFDLLEIEKAPVLGASNGGYIAQVLAYYYPEKVESLALFGPMGLTQLTGGSIFMMSVASMYPFQFIRNWVTKWAIGNDKYCNDKYGDWFNCIMKSTIPSIGQPVPMTTEQKHEMKMPILLFLGTRDGIVGEANVAKKAGQEYPNIDIEVLESGHLVATEHRDFVNQKLKEFLELE